jgi:hypothetical protein
VKQPTVALPWSISTISRSPCSKDNALLADKSKLLD